MLPDEDDVRLHERLIAGDDDALAEVYDRWAGHVHGLAMRVTADHALAEDVTQDVFVHLWERPEAFDPHQGTLRSWLCMLAHRRSVDHIRRRIARSQRQVLSADVTDHSGVDESVILETEAKVVREAVRALPEAQLDAVLLAYFGGRTYREVAQELGIPEGTAKSRLRAALSSLADRLEAQGILER